MSRLDSALARVAELQHDIHRIDEMEVAAHIAWLRSTPTDRNDKHYEAHVEMLAAAKTARQCELASVRMGALL